MRAAAFVLALAVVLPAHGANWGAAAAFMDGYNKAGEERQELEYRRRMQELEIERMRQYNELQRQRIANERVQADAQAKREAESKEDGARRVQEAIDRNPTLKMWQETNAPQWKRAVEIDAVYRMLPETSGLSLEARFDKVVRFVESEFVKK